MRDMEHEEWLENLKARKATKKPKPMPPATRKTDDRKRDESVDDQEERMQRGEL